MLFDLTIVGGGPAGLYAAFYAGLRDLKTKIIEADVELGGRLRYYPEKPVWDVGGLPPTTGAKLRTNLVAQALTFDPAVVTGTRVTSVLKGAGNDWVLTTSDGGFHRSRTVLLAVGYGTLGTRRLEVPGAAALEGRGIAYSLSDPSLWSGRSLVISGGGGSAVDWARQAAEAGARVTLVHRRAEFRAHERVVAGLADVGVRVLVPWVITQVAGPSGVLSQVSARNLDTGETESWDTDGLLVGHGMDFTRLEEGRWALGRPGVFSAGDCVARPGKANLIASTFPEAIEAVNAVKLFLEPGADAQAMVSSHNAKFDQLRDRATVPGVTPNSF